MGEVIDSVCRMHTRTMPQSHTLKRPLGGTFETVDYWIFEFRPNVRSRAALYPSLGRP